MSKDKSEKIINLQERVEVTITEKGAEMKENGYEKGAKVVVHPIMAAYYEKHGVAKITGQVNGSKPKKEDK